MSYFNPSMSLESAEENVIYVFSKTGDLLFIADGDNDGESEESLSNQIVNPVIKLTQNGESSLSFQILKDSWIYKQIIHPENLYYVNRRMYSCLNESSYTYTGDGTATIVNVVATEIFYLLSRSYKQAYNCGLYAYGTAIFSHYVADGAVFTINASDCSIPGKSISRDLAWQQVRLWSPTDDNGNELVYTIVKSDEFPVKGWDDAPGNVRFSSISLSGNTLTIVAKTATKGEVTHNFDWNWNNTYQIESKPLPSKLNKVTLNITNVASQTDAKKTTVTSYEKNVSYSYSSSIGRFLINYKPTGGETVNFVSVKYDYCNLGDIKPGATCTFGYGAEVVDEHTFLILPKADKRYKLTIDGVQYEDTSVRDSRGVVMPRGSGGYAMWAALKNTGWSLGICDVIAKDFDTSIDYGCFNVESDQKNVLEIIEEIQELYGGILDWNSRDKILNYRAEDYEHYEAYRDGFNDWTGYEFREGKNLQDQPQITVDNDIITRAYLLGYGGLNVKKLNGGKTYIDNFSFTNDLYEGYLEQPLIYDTRSDSGMNQLLYWGKKELEKKCRPRKRISLNVYDIRTVEGYEHEIFDINDVVRCYYRDTETGEETFEEKRVVSYEYEVFSRYNSTVELGDKVSNLSELFRLIFNTAMDSPKPGGDGNISSNDVVMDNGESLPKYIELLARTTTSNTDAIANLVLQTSNLFSSVDLFAQYQSRLDNLFTDTYAGLSFYADQVGSNVLIEARGEYTDLVKNLRTETRAGFEASQTRDEALARQYAELRQDTQDGFVESQAYMKSYVNNEIATNDVIAMFTKNDITSISQLNQYVSEEVASYDLIASLERHGIYGYAGIRSMVENTAEGIVSSINLEVQDSWGGKYLSLTSGGLELGSINMDELTPAGIITDYDSSSAWGLPALQIIGYALNLTSEVGDIYLTTGAAYIHIKSDGEIALVGDVTINGEPYSSGNSGDSGGSIGPTYPWGYSLQSETKESNAEESDLRQMFTQCMNEIELLKKEIEELKNEKRVEN